MLNRFENREVELAICEAAEGMEAYVAGPVPEWLRQVMPSPVLSKVEVGLAFLELDVGIINALDAAGFRTIQEVADATDAELLAVPGIGQVTLGKIRAQVKELDY